MDRKGDVRFLKNKLSIDKSDLVKFDDQQVSRIVSLYEDWAINLSRFVFEYTDLETLLNFPEVENVNKVTVFKKKPSAVDVLMDMLPDNTIDFRNPLEYFKQNKEDYERLREVLGSFHLKGDARLPRASEGIKYVRDILKLYERDMKALEVAALISEQFYFGDPSPKDNITLDFFYSDPTQNPAKFLDAIAAQLQNELEGQFGFVSSALNWHKMRNRLDDVCNGNYNQSENTAYDGCMILFSEALYTPGNTKTNETGAIINEARKCINEVARGNDFYRPLIIRAFDHCYMNRAAKLYKDYLTLTAGDVGKPK